MGAGRSGVKCFVKTCGKTRRKNPSLIFHRLPKNEKRLNAWLAAVGKEELLLNKTVSELNKLRICGSHFEKSDYLNLSISKFLNKNAVPSLNIPKPAANFFVECTVDSIDMVTEEVTTSSQEPIMEESVIWASEKCCYHSCKTTAAIPEKHFFHFPMDNRRSTIWILNAERYDLLFEDPMQLSSRYVLCEDHFEDNQFVNASEKKRLVWNALPMLFDTLSSKPMVLKQILSQLPILQQEKPSTNIHYTDHDDYCKPTLSSEECCHLNLNYCSVLPLNLCVKQTSYSSGGLGIWALEDIPMGIRFGPYQETCTHLDCHNKETKANELKVTDDESEVTPNWLQYVNYACSKEQQNLIAVHNNSSVYYITCKVIPANTELLVWNHDGDLDSVKECHVASREKVRQLKKDVSTMCPDDKNGCKENHNCCGNKHQCQLLREKVEEKVAEANLPKANISNSKMEKPVSVPKKVFPFAEYERKYQEPAPNVYYIHLKCSPTSNGEIKFINSCKQIASKPTDAHERCYSHKTDRSNCTDVILQNKSLSERIARMLKVIAADITCESANKVEYLYRCDLCGKQLRSRDTLTRHKKIHSRPYKCDVCNRGFACKSRLVIHKRIHTGEKPYRCKKCERQYISPMGLKQHEAVHSHERPFKCNICEKTFQHKASFRNHQNLHSSEKPFKCNMCEKAFVYKGSLVSHQKIHVCEEHYKCRVCSRKLSTKARLKLHEERMHFNKKPFEYVECRKRFSCKYKLVAHQQTHTGAHLSKCNICGKRYDRRYLNRHKLIHRKETPYLCHYCGRMFAWYVSLSLHEMFHADEKQWECVVCGKKLTSKYRLLLHEKIHTGTQPHKCNICGKKFSLKWGLKTHIKIHSGEKPYLCHICGRRFAQLYNLKRHEMVHTRQKYYECSADRKNLNFRDNLLTYKIHTNAWPYKCNICGRRYTRLNYLKVHQMTHSGEKPYLCHVCGKTFLLYTCFKLHQAKHSGEKTYQCNVCTKKFLCRNTLKQHIKVHSVIPL